jgi:hypothetical protein
MNFYDFWNRLNGEPYSDPRVPPPPDYKLGDYSKEITNSGNLAGVDNQPDNWGLTPLGDEDMVQPSTTQPPGAISTRLGKAMTDEEFKKHFGINW